MLGVNTMPLLLGSLIDEPDCGRGQSPEDDMICLEQELIDVSDSVLVIIDVQDLFLVPKLGAERSRLLLNRIGWLMDVAQLLDVPMVAMNEFPELEGAMNQELAAKLPKGSVIHDKRPFGLAGQPEILHAIEATHRKTCVLVGLETDVCVAQSAIGLLQKGYRVVALADATASPGDAHEIGLERMRRGGALISSVKAVFYEWLRNVEAAVALEERSRRFGGDVPEGVEI